MNFQKIISPEPEHPNYQDNLQEDTSQGTACLLNNNPVSIVLDVQSQPSDFIVWTEPYANA